MKKIILAGSFALSLLAYSQEEGNRIRFGIAGGLNYSRVTNAHRPSGPRYTFQAGGVALIPLGESNKFFIQPEVLYYGAGETGRDSYFDNIDKATNGYNAVYANTYISVPVYLKAYFSKKPSEFFAVAGPRFNFLIKQDVKNIPLDKPFYNPDDKGISSFNGKSAAFNFGVGLGLGYSFKREWELVMKYDYGLSNTYKGITEINTKHKSEQVISIGLNYIFK